MRKGLIYLTLFMIFLSACTKTTTRTEPCMEVSGSDRDECYHKLALDTEANLLNICDKISDNDKKTACLFELVDKKTINYNCEMFTTQADRDECYMIFGANMNRVALCDKIQNENLKNSCYNENVKFFKLSEVRCNVITDESMKQDCLIAIKKV